MSDGEISPKVIREFENRCAVYFMNEKGGDMDDQKVTKILGSFENTLVDDWMSTERDRIVQMTFTDFMDEFRERWLPTNREQTVLTQMLGTHLDPTKQRFEAWAAQILSHNVSLRTTKSHMTDEALRRQMEIMLDEELRTLACEAKVSEITSLRACPAHVLSDAVSLKIFELFFTFRARQFDRPANFIANFCDIVASDRPAKNKNESGLVFFRNLNRFCCSCVIVTPHL